MSDILKEGSKGEGVSALQQKLVGLGFALEVDGIFGPKTDAAVQQLQTLFGYDVDGKVGPGTRKLIDAQAGYGWSLKDPEAVKKALKSQGKTTEKGNLAGADAKRTLKAGLEGPDVSVLQRRLNALGYAIAVTGSFDAATEKAVKDLQAKFGYDVDGIVGPGTHVLINAQIGHDWNVSKAADGEGKKAAAPDKKDAGGGKGLPASKSGPAAKDGGAAKK